MNSERLWTIYARKLAFVTIDKGDIMKKFTALLLIFSLMAISCATMTTQRQKRFESSKERKQGAKLIVTKLDGQLIEGELITVKPNSLLLLDTEGKDVSVDIGDIRVITIVKKSQVVWGALGGLLGGALFGAFMLGMIGLIVKASWGETLSLMVEHGWPFAPLFAIVGGIAGAVEGIDKTILVEGMTDLKIQKTLDKLRKKARIRDYR